MAFSCSAKIAKCILILFNVLIWICGAVVLGLGIWFLVDENATKLLHIATIDTSLALVRGTAIALVTVGAIAFITGFFGCCGAIQESRCMLNTYAVILTMLLILQVAAGIAGVVFKDRIDAELEKSMNTTVHSKFKYNGTDDTTIAFNFMQKEFKCCGQKSPLDWDTSEWKKDAKTNENVPTTCCVEGKDGPQDWDQCQALAYKTQDPTRPKYVHVEGCQEQLGEWIRHNAGILIGVAFGLALVQIISIILACCLKRNVDSAYQYV